MHSGPGRTTVAERVDVRVPAKLNLFLAVRGARADGYHELVTVLQTVSLHDRLRVTITGPPGRRHHPSSRRHMRISLRVHGPPDASDATPGAARGSIGGSAAGERDALPSAEEGIAPGGDTGSGTGDALRGLPAPVDNLAVRAALLLAQRAGLGDLAVVSPPEVGNGAFTEPRSAGQDAGPGRAPSGAPSGEGSDVTAGPVTVVDLEKRIPIAGGMAGGSADAAAALLALDALWRSDLGRAELLDLAAQLGSDVPFCLVGGTALAAGRGTDLTPVLCRGAFSWVVSTTRRTLSTAAVYRSWDRWCALPGSGVDREGVEGVDPGPVLAALAGGNATALAAALRNDLEPAAFALDPALPGEKAALLEAGALGAVLSGSGPTLLGLCADDEHARAVAERARRRAGSDRRVSVVRSPAGGPELVT